jgi:hypothetical protein
VREAVEKVNATWFLPAIQRPYDWGERDKKEQFMYKLFDSIVREYPIGTLIVWETRQKIPYRPFLRDYESEKLEKIVDKGHWGKRGTLLIYDGQQRLQSLYSCLNFTFHNKVLCYNLLFDLNLDKRANGFKFFPKQEEPEEGYIRLNEVYSWNPKQQVEFEEKMLQRLRESKKDLSKKEETIAKRNLKQLWKLFVDRDFKLLSSFPLERDMDQMEVVDIFTRINSTGMALTGLEKLFSRIKTVKYDFEEQIWGDSLEIKRQTNGFQFGPDDTLQVLHSLVKGTVRVDPDRVDNSELQEFVLAWDELRSPLKSFFYDFLYRGFRVTHEKTITNKRALLPLIVYFYYMRKLNKRKFPDFSRSKKSIISMKKYLIFSQLLYWDLQGYIDNFCRMIKEGCEKARDYDFPFKKLKDFVADSGRRQTHFKADDFDDPYHRWFVLKIITPDKPFTFLSDPDERFNPEIDHIFPTTPNFRVRHRARYDKWVDTIWNLQPVKGEINGIKLAQAPKDFLTEHSEYLKDYDFLPTKDLNDELWLPENAHKFIQARKMKIIAWIKQNYRIDIESRAR